MGINEATFYVWKKKCSGIGSSELHRLRQLEEENPKQIVVDLSSDMVMLQSVVASESLMSSNQRQCPGDLGLLRETSPDRTCTTFWTCTAPT